MRPQTELGLGTAGVSSSRLAKEGQSSLDNFPMRKLVALSSTQLEYLSKTTYYKKNIISGFPCLLCLSTLCDN